MSNPEIAGSVIAAGIRTNVHDIGSGHPVLLIHGSGPGVSAWANWRLVMPELAQQARVIAPDMVGFGFTDRPAGQQYDMAAWVAQAVGVLDALGIEKTDLVGNSFGGALALALTIRHPQRVRRLVLMGSVGVPFPITKGLDDVWGYEPSFENMRRIMDVFAYDRNLVNDELARLRYGAAPALGRCHVQRRGRHPRAAAPGADRAWPRRPGDSAVHVADAVAVDCALATACVRPVRALDAN